jgi:hypothetical protein
MNKDAVPLFFLMLQEADESDTLWGLALWHRLAAESLVNATACKQAGLFPLLLAWFSASPHAPGHSSAAAEDSSDGDAATKHHNGGREGQASGAGQRETQEIAVEPELYNTAEPADEALARTQRGGWQSAHALVPPSPLVQVRSA